MCVEYLNQSGPRYLRAGLADKRPILDELCSVSCCVRK
jgi:hypothetical protein